MVNTPMILTGMGVYFLFIVFVGVWYSKRANKNPENYFLGGRSLGPWVSALSAEASDMSGWLLMGLPGVAYFTGSGEAFWTAMGLAIGTLINWQIVSKRLRVYSETANNAITLPSFFSNRYHDKVKILSIIAALLLIVFFSIYASSQFVAFGKLFEYVIGSNQYYTQMVLIGAAIVFIYTLLGGFLGESFCDLIQALLMIGSILLVFVFAAVREGGFAQVIANLQNYPRFLDVFGIATPTLQDGVQQVANGAPLFGPGKDYGFLNIVSCMAWGLGYFGMPQVLLRFMAIKKADKLKQAKVIGVVWCFISLFAAVALGMLARALYPTWALTSGDSEKVFLHMATTFFPPLLAGLVLSGILGASMSSCDSYMLITSSSLSNDILKGKFIPSMSEKAVLWCARGTIVLVTIFGLAIALTGSDSIFRIVSYAWAGLGASFGPLILFSLFWKRTTLPGAAAGMLTGGIMVVVWKNLIAPLGGALAVYELLPAFILSALAIWVVSLATKEPDKSIQDEFAAFLQKMKG